MAKRRRFSDAVSPGEGNNTFVTPNGVSHPNSDGVDHCMDHTDRGFYDEENTPFPGDGYFSGNQGWGNVGGKRKK